MLMLYGAVWQIGLPGKFSGRAPDGAGSVCQAGKGLAALPQKT